MDGNHLWLKELGVSKKLFERNDYTALTVKTLVTNKAALSTVCK